ncbi:DUF4890 domain-containing protein [Spirosoma aerolatum]|uniref:DUF4890 domain-containing protein n=1 Tax=Spirosoma aerolatum TaxID=1211326 RepID=UPI001FE47F9D|nr:DUF4890 domain-containing protein [Spirosoma aerolatum]
MIKKLMLSGLMLSLLSLPLLAQTATSEAPAQTSPRMGRGRTMQSYQAADPATRAQRMTDRMKQQLGLDDATTKKVYDATLARAQKVDAIQKGSDDNKAKAQSLKANADDYKAKLKAILTPDQFAKLESMRSQMRKEHRGPGDANNEQDNN